MDLEQRLEAERLYRAAVGPNADYYASKFIGFDTYDSSRISWNWPAFFCTFPWMLYRRMYGYAAAYFLLVPLLVTILAGVIRLALPPELSPFFALGLSTLILLIAPAMYANAMYHANVATRLVKSRDESDSADAQAQRLENERPTNIVAAMLGSVLALASGGWSLYQRDVRGVEPQVADAIAHTGYIQSDLEQFYKEHDRRWPTAEANFAFDDSAKGDFVEKLDIHEGDLVITFGGASTGRLQGKQLLMKAVVSDPLRVDWVCSEAMPTTVAKRYWPRNCDTRDIRIATHEQPAVVATQTVRFASGNATAVLPATHEVVLTDGTLTSTFGAKRDHKLEITLVRDLLKSPDGDLGAKFVELQAARARVTATRTEYRTIMSEAGADLVIDGRSYETTHWQIGANNCVFTMTLTAPFPLTTDHRDFFYGQLQELLDSIACVYPAATAAR